MLQSSSRGGGGLPGRGRGSPWSWGGRAAWSRGGSPWSRGGLPCPGGVSAWSRGVSLVRGGECLPGPGGVLRKPPPVNRITDTCKNITLATTSLRPVKMKLPTASAIITGIIYN